MMEARRRTFTSLIPLAFMTACLAFIAPPAAVLAGGLPELPATNYDYFDYAVTSLPQHFFTNQGGPGGASVVSRDNTPANNQITNAGATLGRVLFYDKRLSHGNGVACASCHGQDSGFSDRDQFSTGVNGETPRHSMALTNTKFYENGRMFWDERSGSLEHQVLQPIQNPIEMDTSLSDMRTKVSNTSYYGSLFNDAFGSPDVTDDRISKALSQFVRSMVSYDSEFDNAFNQDGQLNRFALTPSQRRGHGIFNGAGRCATCHQSNAQVANGPSNNGLDRMITDEGAGNGTFKVPSLRNVEFRDGFMHDGRFETLEEVVDFYSTGIQNSPNLDLRLRQNGQAVRFNFTDQETNDLVAFLEALTDDTFLTADMFSDPFGDPCDFNLDGDCNIVDLDLMLAEGPIINGVLVDASGNELFDLNGDGTVDDADVDQWLNDAATENGLSSSYIYGDSNLDGFVDASDFNAWNEGKFTQTTEWSSGDFNGDGAVDASDFNVWNENKFTSSQSAVTAVPEPQGFLLISPLPLLLLAARSGRKRQDKRQA